MPQAGLAEAALQAVSDAPAMLRPALMSTVLLIGGNCNLTNLPERTRMELRPACPDTIDLQVSHSPNPELAAWRGGAALAASPSFSSLVVTRAEYEEHGSALCRKRFRQEITPDV
mmetsp:Transcript_13944/g.30251  ORF Transcript_13944/g.30251 Transcript_13944/m.30251 type:complete len:115 (+) Transcript_13944:538-882(+)